MEEVSLSETESRYYGDLFLCCDVEKTGKIPMLKATELYRSANLNNDVILEITSLAGIPETALHISRAQFYSCLKLIAAHQAAMSLRQELLTAATVQLPLPRFSWKESSINCEVGATNSSDNVSLPIESQQTNGLQPSEQKLSLSGNTTNLQKQQDIVNSDILSTDSEVELNESSCGDGPGGENNTNTTAGSSNEAGVGSGRDKKKHHGLSPEAWSTNSDSPTPTNSVAERPWAKETLWQGLLGDEHRQLLGTEEESSDRHSSDDDDDDDVVEDIEKLYQITYEQREYYYKQFKTVQPDDRGLLSGHVARMFFEKSRIPVEQLRHIWQLCDVTRDGALSLEEFIAAMHLVVLRRNNIPLPAVLPTCLHPSVLQHVSVGTPPADGVLQEPAEADLLHLNDEDDEDNTDKTILMAANSKNIMNASTLSATSQASIVGVATNNSTIPSPLENKLSNNSPSIETTSVVTPQNSSGLNSTTTTVAIATNKQKDRSLWTTEVPPTQWTKFSESPTSNVSSPGPKPVNFDMQRTAQAVVSDPQILHPVPLRVTPVAGAQTNASTVGTTSTVSTSTADTLNPDPGLIHEGVLLRDNSPKQFSNSAVATTTTSATAALTGASLVNKDTLQGNDLRAIQRPQAKKLLPPKNAGALPPPPQREPSLGGGTTGDSADTPTLNHNNNNSINNNHNMSSSIKKLKDVPPIPPPRPSHRHGRSSSLDLNKFKITTPGFHHEENDGRVMAESVLDGENQQMHSLIEQPVSLPPTRLALQSNQRVSAFEVYRKPHALSQNLPESPTPIQHEPLQDVPFGAGGATAIAAQPQLPNTEHYEKRVNAISDTLRHVSFKADTSMTEILRHLREQNNLLLRLCNDLSDELLTVQTRKEEIRLKLDNFVSNGTTTTSEGGQTIGRTASSISAPVTANVTGGSANSTIMTTTFL